MTDTRPTKPNLVEEVVTQYGDLLFDLCESVLWSASNAKVAFRRILKSIQRRAGTELYHDFLRAWVLRVACSELLTFALKHGRRLSPSEQIMLDAGLNVANRMKQFDSYFHRLSTEEQILLLLKDKHAIPYSEIAMALDLPEGSLKIKRQQALRNLDDWIWGVK